MRYSRFLFLAFILFVFSFFTADANAACTIDSDCGPTKICQNPYGLTNQGWCIPDWGCDIDKEYCSGRGCKVPTQMCIDNKIYEVSYNQINDICNNGMPGYKGCSASKTLIKDCGSPCVSKCVETDTFGIPVCDGVVGPKTAKCVPQPPAPDCKKVQNFKDPALCGFYAPDPTLDGKICTMSDKINKGLCNNGDCIQKECACTDLTPCGSCYSIGNFCKNVNNIGTLVSGEEAVANCPNECVKYVVQTNMRYAKGYTGPHTDTAEICFDTPTGKDANGKTIYANWMVDTYINSNRIMETQCGSDTGHNNMNKCFKYEYGCGQNAVVQDAYVNKDRLPKTTKPIDTTKSYYCAGIPGGSTGGNELPPGPGPCTTCGDPPVCVGQCVPGESPKYYADNSCTIATDCRICGCPPSDYPGTTVTCGTTTGLCSYIGPPELPGDPPNCLLSTPDFEYNKTIVTTGTYLLSGNNLGTFSGYKWNGASWQANSISTGLAEASYSSPAVFFDGNSAYLVSGRGDGGFGGYSWDGTKWVASATANSGLADIGGNSKPAIFYMDGAWNMYKNYRIQVEKVY